MTTVRKASIRLGNVELAATSPIVWKFISGVRPYTATFQVHKTAWRRLSGKMGIPLTLDIVDSRGLKTSIKNLYILHRLPSDSPNRVSFLVADKRWKWQYKLVVRDFNMPRKTGDRTAKFESVPVETRAVVDKYDYLPYSLDDDVTWTAKRAVEEVMELLEGKRRIKGKKGHEKGGWLIFSFPTKDREARKEGAGQFTLQNVTLRDQGDVALSRLLSYVPGAEIYINPEGVAVIFNGTDLDALEQHFRKLPIATWAGEKAAWVDRREVRPKTIVVHYQRELELVLEYEDNYKDVTQADPIHFVPYIDNVIPTVDPETVITEFDPEERKRISKTVPPGTWVKVSDWLIAMDTDRPEGSLPWTFETIKRHWLKGDLDGVLGGRGLDLDETANVSMRIQALKQNFRQTFRINRRYMERIRDIRAVRVALLDPVTGARAPAAVWGQACVIPTTKGKRMAHRTDKERAKVWRNVDYLAPSKKNDTKLIDTAPGPTQVVIRDRELGIFRLEWITSPYGTVESFVPCHLVSEGNTSEPKVVTRDLSKQDSEPMGAGMKVESGTNGIFLKDKMEFKAIVTIVPAAPNDQRQFHRERVSATDVRKLFQKEFRIQGGVGPPLEVFVPPGEATARFAWDVDAKARDTISDLLGLRREDEPDDKKDADDDPIPEGPALPGFVLVNERRYLSNHAESFAAELLAPFADNVMGMVATRIPRAGATFLRLIGNMSGATVRVGAAPSAKVDVLHEFPGQQKPISRFALMHESARAIVLGVVPFKE